jgi:hypothetical protein
MGANRKLHELISQTEVLVVERRLAGRVWCREAAVPDYPGEISSEEADALKKRVAPEFETGDWVILDESGW